MPGGAIIIVIVLVTNYSYFSTLTLHGEVDQGDGGGRQLEVHPAGVGGLVPGLHPVYHQPSLGPGLAAEEGAALQPRVVRPVPGSLQALA